MILNKHKENQFYYKTLFELKSYLNCFSSPKYRIIEGVTLKFENSYVIDIGHKYLIQIKNGNISSYFTILKIFKLETLFKDFDIDYVKFKSDLHNKFNWSVIKKAFENECFLNGKVLNPLRNGFSVGVCGFVGFIPKKYYLSDNHNINSIFVLTNVDFMKKTFTLSQKQIDKVTSRTLFKLSSQITYTLKN
jgi:ribosomal protein S1